MSTVDLQALFTFSYGLYIVSTLWEDKMNGQVADAVMQLTAEPIAIAACLHKGNYTAELLAKSKKFSVSVFSEEVPLPFIGNFGFRSGREHDKFAKCNYKVTELGRPSSPSTPWLPWKPRSWIWWMSRRTGSSSAWSRARRFSPMAAP